MSNVKAKPIPFSGEPAFVEFLDEMATILTTSRSGYLRQAAKEYARQRFPQVYAKHFPDEVQQINDIPKPVTQIQPHVQDSGKTNDSDEEDFLQSIQPKNKSINEPQMYGAPENCPNCHINRYEYENGNIVKTNVQCSTNPNRGRWVCNECTASGEYFPDRPPTIN